ncbi:Uncharacterised protein at_DN1429 [Pycnogonum litorale]
MKQGCSHVRFIIKSKKFIVMLWMNQQFDDGVEGLMRGERTSTMKNKPSAHHHFLHWVDGFIKLDRCFTLDDIHVKFPQVSQTLVHKNCHCSPRMLENLCMVGSMHAF